MRGGGDEIFARLDRFVLSESWSNLFPIHNIKTLDFYGSDHRPVLLQFVQPKTSCKKLEARRFHFEHKWLGDKNFEKDFISEMQCFLGDNSLPEVLTKCQAFLKRWAGTRFDALGKKLNDLREERNRLLAQIEDESTLEKIRVLSAEIERVAKAEEVHWNRRSHMSWMFSGDRNTKLFHYAASERKKQNTISGLLNSQGILVEEETELADVVSEYFSHLFSSSHPSENDIKEVTDGNLPHLSEEDVKMLLEPYTLGEVKKALFSMHPNKAPGLDGFPASFFQHLWPNLERPVSKAVLKVFNNEEDITSWNSTLIVLIPKVREPREVKDYRPISLCNTIYKIVSKVLANRIRKVLNSVIDKTQSAFVPGRMITDNIMIGYECMHKIRNCRRGK